MGIMYVYIDYKRSALCSTVQACTAGSHRYKPPFWVIFMDFEATFDDRRVNEGNY